MSRGIPYSGVVQAPVKDLTRLPFTNILLSVSRIKTTGEGFSQREKAAAARMAMRYFGGAPGSPRKRFFRTITTNLIVGRVAIARPSDRRAFHCLRPPINLPA